MWRSPINQNGSLLSKAQAVNNELRWLLFLCLTYFLVTFYCCYKNAQTFVNEPKPLLDASVLSPLNVAFHSMERGIYAVRETRF